MLNFETVKKIALPVGSLALAFASMIVSNKNNDVKMQKTIADEVAKAVADKMKGE